MPIPVNALQPLRSMQLIEMQLISAVNFQMSTNDLWLLCGLCLRTSIKIIESWENSFKIYKKIKAKPSFPLLTNFIKYFRVVAKFSVSTRRQAAVRQDELHAGSPPQRLASGSGHTVRGGQSCGSYLPFTLLGELPFQCN